MAKLEEKIINDQNNVAVGTYQNVSGNVQNIDNLSSLSSDIAPVGINPGETSTPDTTMVSSAQNIEVQKNSFDFLMKNFRRECAGKVAEVRKREAYVPPSLKRKEKSENARRRKRKSY